MDPTTFRLLSTTSQIRVLGFYGSSSSTYNLLVLPTGIVPGDLIIYQERSSGANTASAPAPAVVTLSGFTLATKSENANGINGLNRSISVSTQYRIANGTELATYSGTPPSGGGSFFGQFIVVKFNRATSSVNIIDSFSGASNGSVFKNYSYSVGHGKYQFLAVFSAVSTVTTISSASTPSLSQKYQTVSYFVSEAGFIEATSPTYVTGLSATTSTFEATSSVFFDVIL